MGKLETKNVIEISINPIRESLALSSIISGLIHGSSSAISAPNLCSKIFSAEFDTTFGSKTLGALTYQELVSKIYNFKELQLPIQKKSYNSENEFIQALAFFERETKGLMLLDPSVQQLYRLRLFENSQLLKKKLVKVDKLKRDDQRARDKVINETKVFNPKEKFTIPLGGEVNSAAFSPDSKYVMTASYHNPTKIIQFFQSLEGAKWNS